MINSMCVPSPAVLGVKSMVKGAESWSLMAATPVCFGS